MNVRLLVAGVVLLAVLGACHSSPSGVAKTDAVQNAQLEQINAHTIPGSGRRMLFATPQNGSTGDQPGDDEPTLGQQMQGSKRPPQ